MQWLWLKAKEFGRGKGIVGRYIDLCLCYTILDGTLIWSRHKLLFTFLCILWMSPVFVFTITKHHQTFRKSLETSICGRHWHKFSPWSNSSWASLNSLLNWALTFGLPYSFLHYPILAVSLARVLPSQSYLIRFLIFLVMSDHHGLSSVRTPVELV